MSRGKVLGLGVLVRTAPLEDVLVTYTPILHSCKYLHTHNKVLGWDTGPIDSRAVRPCDGLSAHVAGGQPR